MKKIHAKRRFDSVNIADPGDVRALDQDHPAMMNSTTLFPSTIAVDGKQKLLISARENRKIGHMVTKGAWRGFPIFTLTLTERDTCPQHCAMLDSCYGNSMPFARRNQPGKLMENQLERELAALASEHFRGFVVRLHVLGDFYSEDYVNFWRAMLAKHKALRIYGYTAHRVDAPDPKNRIIGEAIANMKFAEPERFAIRWSHTHSGPDRAVVIDHIPAGQRVAEGFVCPAEMDKAACCASCGLCWSPEMASETIVFIKHGMGASRNAVIAKTATAVDEQGWRRVAPIENLAQLQWDADRVLPEIVWIAPTELWIDESYQRNLTPRSIKRIQKIMAGWRWEHYGVPNVDRDRVADRLSLIDGQHTAIAAATLGIPKIPVLITETGEVRKRALAFVSRNDDRVQVTGLQKHRANVVGEDPETLEIEAACSAAGIRILRFTSPKQNYAPGETVSLTTVRLLFRQYGAVNASKVLRSVRGCAPVRADDIKAATKLLLDPIYRDAVSEETLARLHTAAAPEEIATEARRHSAMNGMRTWESQVIVLYRRVKAAR